MYLHVLLVNDTIEASDLLCLLGVGLLKLRRRWFIWRNTTSMSVQSLVILGAKKSIFIHMAKSRFTSLNADF